jgi:MinD-like ATPase involved in chromosome partitioning or flagellar assembly
VALVCVGSAHGAPGATTLAVLAAGCWPRPVVLVEADPCGGMLAIRYGLGRTPGLADLAAAVGNHAAPAALWSAAQVLPGGLRVVVAPESGEIVSGILADAARALGVWCAGLGDADVVVDCGRFSPASAAAGVVAAADAVILAVRPTAEDLYPAAHRVRALAALAPRAVVGLVLVGSRPYDRGEVSGQLGVRVLGVVDDDAPAARIISNGGAARALRRSGLARSVAALVDDLTGRLDVPASDPEAPVAPSGSLAAAVKAMGAGS